TGQAVAAALAARGVHVRAADARPTAALGVTGAPAGVELRFGEDGPQLLAGVELVVPSPGVPRDAPVLAAAGRRGIPVWSEIELAFRLLACPLVAITGTNGKSTTTSLVGLALERAGRRTFIGGNLGTPLISALDQAPEIAVAEVSSFQLEWVERLRPRVGCLLNLTPDHLDRHASFAEYREAKARLFAAQEAEDFAVVNRDDAEAWRAVVGVRARVVSFGAGAVACGAFAGPVVLLAGGVDKGGGYDALAASAAGKVRLALVFGEAADRVGAALAAVAVPVERVRTLEQAVARAAAVAGAGDTVLLAPACASFDMFADYAARGRAFRAAVEALARSGRAGSAGV